MYLSNDQFTIKSDPDTMVTVALGCIVTELTLAIFPCPISGIDVETTIVTSELGPGTHPSTQFNGSNQSESTVPDHVPVGSPGIEIFT